MRTSQNYSNNLINEDGTKNMEAYKDSYVKEQMIVILKKVHGWDLYINPDDYGVDLLSKDGTFGVELEHGGWDNDFWLDKYYPYKSKELNYAHVNMPGRKKKWYKEYYNVNLEPDRNKKPIWSKKHNPTFENNVFIRTNKQLTQMITIWPDTVFTNSFEDKMIYASNSGKVEPFMCFKRENVETRDLLNDDWVIKPIE